MAKKKNFLDGMGNRIKRMEQAIAEDKAREFEQRFKAGISDADVTRNKTRVQVSRALEDQGKQVIDMKPFFKNSPKAKKTKNGGWYLVVPIRRFTGRDKDTREKASGMSSRLYKDVNRQMKGGTSNTIVSDYLYDNRKGSFSPVPELNYTPKSNNISKMKNTKGRGSTYVSFRVVGSNSAPSSWIINREHANPDNLSVEVQKIVDATRRQKN